MELLERELDSRLERLLPRSLPVEIRQLILAFSQARPTPRSDK